MSDAAHNTLVTILLIVAAVIVFVLLGRWLQSNNGMRYSYSYQPASAVEVYRSNDYYRMPMHTSNATTTVTAYPQTYNSGYQSSTYTTETHSYTCTDTQCWRNW